MSAEVRRSSYNPGAQSSTVAVPLDVEAMAVQYQQDRASFLQLMQAMALQVHAARAESEQAQALVSAMSDRVSAVCDANQAMVAEVASQRLENRALQVQVDACRDEASQLRGRVEVVSTQNAELQRQRQEVERNAALARQRLERQLQAQRDAAERANLQAELVECEAALAKLNHEEANEQASLGSMGALSGAVLGFAAAGPVGAALLGAAFGASGVGMSAEDAANKNAAERSRLNEEVTRIKARLLVLPQS